MVNSVNFEDGDGPTSRFGRIMPLVKEHGAAVIALTIDEEGQARTAETKVAIASRLIDTLVDDWGVRLDDIVVDTLTFPIATGQEETRRDGIETIEAIRELTTRYPGVHTTLGVSNVSFGLNPAARTVLNSVFLHEASLAGLDSAIVHAAKILPLASIPDEQRQAALDLVWDKRVYDDEGNLTHDPWPTCWTCSPGSTPQRSRTPEPPRWRRCPWVRGSSAGSSTASARASRPTSTRRSTRASGRSTSSTTTSWRA
ncbi:dihydropteroate synthase [Oerskovia sp. M15]